MLVPCLHASTDQEERQWAIREFKEERKDVLVATDVASKGLDFPNIQHVINYDMPADIENYGTYNIAVHLCSYLEFNVMYVCKLLVLNLILTS